MAINLHTLVKQNPNITIADPMAREAIREFVREQEEGFKHAERAFKELQNAMFGGEQTRKQSAARLANEVRIVEDIKRSLGPVIEKIVRDQLAIAETMRPMLSAVDQFKHIFAKKDLKWLVPAVDVARQASEYFEGNEIPKDVSPGLATVIRGTFPVAQEEAETIEKTSSYESSAEFVPNQSLWEDIESEIAMLTGTLHSFADRIEHRNEKTANRLRLSAQYLTGENQAATPYKLAVETTYYAMEALVCNLTGIRLVKDAMAAIKQREVGTKIFRRQGLAIDGWVHDARNGFDDIRHGGTSAEDIDLWHADGCYFIRTMLAWMSYALAVWLEKE